MEFLNNEFNVGADKPFDVIHISDTHFAFADERDDKRKNELARHRVDGFPNSINVIDSAVSAARDADCPVMCTGDLIDFVSELNLDYIRKYMELADIFTCAGNHEFSLYVGEAWEDEEYRNRSLPKVQACYKNNIRFSSRVINGINFVALDNSYYLISEDQLTALKNEVDRGLPVVLMVHTPLYAEDIHNHVMNVLGRGDAALMSVPEYLLRGYSDYRYRQQCGDDITRIAYDYIKNEPAIKLILTGHLHFDFISELRPGLLQVITGTETIRKIRFT